LSLTEALAAVLGGPDRWLAAIGIVLVGQGKLIEPAALQDAWLPAWCDDPDPVIREAALYTARRLELEIEMEDTTEMAALESLSAVERAIFLKQVPFFASMTVDQLRTLADIAEEQYLDEGDTIFDEGDAGEALYIIVGGRVGIEREPKKGRVQRLETLSARQYFGERTIFDGAQHENRAVAIDQVHLLAVRREPLLALIRRSSDLSLSLVTILSQRLREADAKLAARTRPKPDQVMKLYDRLTGEE
jgi:CRP-like cAMP-binding protein